MTDERSEIMRRVWVVLMSPLAMMSRPDWEEAVKLAREHELTVAELLEFVYERRRKG